MLYIEKARVNGQEYHYRDAEAIHLDEWLDIIHPIGSIAIFTSRFDPNTFGGEWVPYGEGRVLIGVDPNDPLFNAPRLTGGSKNAIIPKHTHSVSGYTADAGSHSHTTIGAGQHSHTPSNGAVFSVYTGTRSSEQIGEIKGSKWVITQVRKGGSWGGVTRTSEVAAHTHGVSTDGAHNHALNFTSGESGVSPENANLGPYITVYIWERIS